MSSSMGFGWHPIYELENKIHNPFMFENYQPDITTRYDIIIDILVQTFGHHAPSAGG